MPEPVWTHVDEEFHELGSMSYKFRIDAAFAECAKENCEERGLHTRTVAYEGFPIDTGSVVALKLLNPNLDMLANLCSKIRIILFQ